MVGHHLLRRLVECSTGSQMVISRVCNGHGHDQSHGLKYMTSHELVTVVMTGQILDPFGPPWTHLGPP